MLKYRRWYLHWWCKQGWVRSPLTAPETIHPPPAKIRGPDARRSTDILSIIHLSLLPVVSSVPYGPESGSVVRMDEPSMPGAFPSGPDDTPTGQRAPKKKFVGRRTLEAQGKLKQDFNGGVEETAAIVPSSESVSRWAETC